MIVVNSSAPVPVLLIRALCRDSLVMLWVSGATGELVHSTLQSWN